MKLWNNLLPCSRKTCSKNSERNYGDDLNINKKKYIKQMRACEMRDERNKKHLIV